MEGVRNSMDYRKNPHRKKQAKQGIRLWLTPF